MKPAARAAVVAGLVLSVILAVELFLYADHDLKIGSPINLDGDVWVAPMWFYLTASVVAALVTFFTCWHSAIEDADKAAAKAAKEAARAERRHSEEV